MAVTLRLIMEQIIKFDPTVEQLNQIVESTSKITADDLSDDVKIALVKETRIKLRDSRIVIEKQGKSMREGALKFQKDVIAREKELVAIIEPEEKRLKEIEDQATLIRVRAARSELLPMRKQELGSVVFDMPTDEFILDLDNDEFITYLNTEIGLKNIRDRDEIEREKTRLADEARIAQVKKDAEVAERNRIEQASKADEERRINKAAEDKINAEKAAQKLIDDARIEAARIAREAQEEVDRARIAREIEEKVAADKKANQEAQEKYLEWAKSLGWSVETSDQFRTEHTANGIHLWKIWGTYQE